MTYLIAITGKGGTGKTTVAALLLRRLLERGIRPVLALDADPNSSLAPLTGAAGEPTISDIRDEMLAEKGNAAGIPKQKALELKIEECIQEADGFDILTMGRPEGVQCYCYVNNLVRSALSTLKTNYRATVVDNEAGMEHLSRMNTDAVDCLVTVCEPTLVSARAAERIVTLASRLPVTVRRTVLVWNKAPDSKVPNQAQTIAANVGFDDSVVLPMNDEVARLAAEERNVFSAALPDGFGGLLDTCIAHV